MSDGKVLLAAGGLLERRESGGTEIALVRRVRYVHSDGSAGDVVLPKGKLEEDETLEAAALREVLEETGCVGRIVGPAFPIHYEVRGTPKLVSFFRMELVAEGSVRDSSEVRGVLWVSPREAVERLTYESERDVVRSAYRAETATGGP